MKKITRVFGFIAILLFTIVIAAQSSATYDINFTSSWNSADHGVLPDNAHWSNLVGAIHNANITFLEVGNVASESIEDIAEVGSNSAFNSEVNSAINSGDAKTWLQQPFTPYAAISSATLTDVVVTENFPLLSLVSMIAPSPDWMIAVSGLNLWDTNLNQWKPSFSIDLYVYDAGTENGYNYSYDNSPTMPQYVIAKVSGATGYPFGTEKIGTLSIALKSTTLSVGSTAYQNRVNLFPNPNYGYTLTITNADTLKKIDIYNVLGKRVKQRSSTSFKSTEIFDTSNLNKGVYIVRLTNLSNTIESRRLIIN
ncbi:MAG: T9SS type A sorting domain-containing protein [Winogradskyella sp.]|uniref:T9SS type A sorting domain-containing protein n=1 Tax=Winogradskyella sp. TaxID=1883156 RepID=UPI0017A47DD8|nr:T9SS type A sorting domain-containing protein [Winogradskyella sp.]